jgi:hypothetical protein
MGIYPIRFGEAVELLDPGYNPPPPPVELRSWWWIGILQVLLEVPYSKFGKARTSSQLQQVQPSLQLQQVRNSSKSDHQLRAASVAQLRPP